MIKNLTKIKVLLTPIKTGMNSYKLQNEIRQMLFLLHQHNKITLSQFNLTKSL